MRVFFALSLLCMSMLGVSGQYVTSSNSNNNLVWIFTAPATATGSNPTLTLTAGQTYNFSLAASNSIHPFAFSATGSTTTTTTTPIDTTVYSVTQTGCSGDGTSTNSGFYGTSCIVSLAIKANAPNATIYYKCTNHPAMTGTITVIAAAAPTTGPTTAAPTIPSGNGTNPTTPVPSGNGTNPTTPAPGNPTTPAPTTPVPTQAPTTGGTITSNAWHITNSQGPANQPPINAWVFTDKGVQYANPTIQVIAGQPVTISFEFGGSQYHPFSFSSKSNTDTVMATQDYFPNALNGWQVNTASTCDTTSFNSTIKSVKVNPTTWSATSPCVITVQTQASDAGTTLYYRCAVHPKMVGQINVIKGSSASTVTGAGMALVVAFIVALFA